MALPYDLQLSLSIKTVETLLEAVKKAKGLKTFSRRSRRTKKVTEIAHIGVTVTTRTILISIENILTEHLADLKSIDCDQKLQKMIDLYRFKEVITVHTNCPKCHKEMIQRPDNETWCPDCKCAGQVIKSDFLE